MVGEDLHGLTLHLQLGALFIIYPVTENGLGGHTVDKGGLDEADVAIPQWILEFEIGAHERCQQALFLIDLKEIEAVLPAPRIAAILEILEVVAMPDDAHGIDLAETYTERGDVDEVAHWGASNLLQGYEFIHDH